MATDTTRTVGDSVSDRQRERAARGVRTRQAVSTLKNDRPAPPRRRRPAMAALSVLLIVGGAALAGLLALNLDSRTPVVVVNQDIAVGTQITADMLGTAPVASEGLLVIPEDQAGEVIGTYARVPLTQGQLLDTSMVTRAEPLGSGTAQVGVLMRPGLVPPGLRSGDEVRLVRLADGASGEARPLAVGLVLQTASTESGGIVDTSTAGNATLLVPDGAADAVVDAAANERLGMALVRRGVALDDADLSTLGGGS